jgi:hypothetical protein
MLRADLSSARRSIFIGHACSHRPQSVQTQGNLESITSWSMPSRAKRTTFLTSSPSTPVTGQPPAQVPQVRHRSAYWLASLRFSRLEINNGSITLSLKLSSLMTTQRQKITFTGYRQHRGKTGNATGIRGMRLSSSQDEVCRHHCLQRPRKHLRPDYNTTLLSVKVFSKKMQVLCFSSQEPVRKYLTYTLLCHT